MPARTMSLYTIPVQTLEGRRTTLAGYRGKTLLIVNVASQCGFTTQYTGLEALYRRHRAAGLVVLGFPCDQFGQQEPGDAEEIRRFCSLTYDVTFPLFAKVAVNGPDAHPLFEYLKAAQPGMLGSRAIKWNFTKFLVAPDGEVVQRYAPADTPERIEQDLAPLLESSS
jgi:glutathione peroxidase